jgi:AcrR family transcriptional regulator
MARRTADERREHVLEAAIAEIAAQGYHAASTTAIARRAGISQPYIYALFPSKTELFLEVDRYVVDRIRRAFLDAARGKTTPGERLEAMGQAYMELLANRDEIRFQMQAHAAAGNPELAEPIRKEFTGLWEDVKRMSGAPEDQVREFMAKGMLLNVVASLELADQLG